MDDNQRVRMRRRFLLILLLALVPVVAVLAAVFSSQPHLLCGSWWYGVAASGWLAWRLV